MIIRFVPAVLISLVASVSSVSADVVLIYPGCEAIAERLNIPQAVNAEYVAPSELVICNETVHTREFEKALNSGAIHFNYDNSIFVGYGDAK